MAELMLLPVSLHFFLDFHMSYRAVFPEIEQRPWFCYNGAEILIRIRYNFLLKLGIVVQAVILTLGRLIKVDSTTSRPL